MRSIAKIFFLLLLLFACYGAWRVFGSLVNPPAEKYIFIHDKESYEEVKADLLARNIIPGGFTFDKLASLLKYKARVRPGRYEIKSGSIWKLVRLLKSGLQSPVKLVITKLRTKEDLAGKISRNFECDSISVLRFLKNDDSLAAYKLDSNTVMTALLPDTYQLLWTSSFAKIFARFKTTSDDFWTENRAEKAAQKNLTPQQAYVLASIVEEETQKAEDKGPIASVYLNRIAAGQMLGADPTVKYAMRNFALKRVLNVHLRYESPYNTYLHKGLPPGPICTPSQKTIDAVLDAPHTDFMYFVAKPDLNGYSNFATTYAQHLIFAKAYQKALDSLILSRRTGSGT